jgi:hypothetical protein
MVTREEDEESDDCWNLEAKIDRYIYEGKGPVEKVKEVTGKHC